MILFGEEYLCKCNQQFDPIKTKVEFYKSLLNEAKLQQETLNLNEIQSKPFNFDIRSEGRQVFTRWNWSYPNRIALKSKRFSIKYEKPLSAVEKLILHNVQKKYLYHAINDILDSLKSQPLKRDNLVAILYSTVLSLQNNFSIDFFDIWIDEVYIHKLAKSNKFLQNGSSNFEPSTYITLKLVYNKKLLPKKPEAFW